MTSVPCPTCGTGRVSLDEPNVLREMRQRAGVTLVAAAGLVGKSVTYLSDVERGQRRLTEEIAEGYLTHFHQEAG